jgi:hypothetical protein
MNPHFYQLNLVLYEDWHMICKRGMLLFVFNAPALHQHGSHCFQFVFRSFLHANAFRTVHRLPVGLVVLSCTSLGPLHSKEFESHSSRMFRHCDEASRVQRWKSTRMYSNHSSTPFWPESPKDSACHRSQYRG